MARSTRILCSIFGFFLMLALLIPQLLLALGLHFANKDLIRSLLCTQDNARQTVELIVADGCEVADGCGLEHLVFDDVFSTEAVLADMEKAVDSALGGEEFHPDPAPMLERLEQNVRSNLCKLENITDTTFYDEEISAFLGQIAGIYGDYLSLKVYTYFEPVLSLIPRVTTLAWLAAALVGGQTLIMLWLMTRKLGLYLRETAFSLVASGGLMAGFMGYLLILDPFGNLRIAPMFLKEALGVYFRDGVTLLLAIGCGTMVLGAVVFAVAAVLIPRGGRKPPAGGSGRPQPLPEEGSGNAPGDSASREDTLPD